MGAGVAGFLGGLNQGVQSRMKAQDATSGKEALAKYMNGLGEQRDNNKANNTKAVNAAKPATSKSGSPSDKYFMQSFQKAKDHYLKDYAQKYRNPNLVNDMALKAKLDAMSPEERDHAAEVDYAKDDPTGHDLISDPNNIKHFNELIKPISTAPRPMAVQASPVSPVAQGAPKPPPGPSPFQAAGNPFASGAPLPQAAGAPPINPVGQ